MPFKNKEKHKIYMREKMRERRSGLKTDTPEAPLTEIPLPEIPLPEIPIQQNIYGYIYCVSNEVYRENIYKIGFTMEKPEVRLKTLFNTSVPYPFKLVFAKRVLSPRIKEGYIHNILEQYRVNPNREFFLCDIEDIYNIFNLIKGEWYDYIE